MPKKIQAILDAMGKYVPPFFGARHPENISLVNRNLIHRSMTAELRIPLLLNDNPPNPPAEEFALPRLILAPGTHACRLTIWTEGAIAKL